MNRLPLIFIIPFLYAFTFNPMSQSIELGGKNKSAQFLIENDSNVKMAIELTVRERKMDQNGKETLPETSEITVFPPQMIIPPNEKRTVRVNWTGPKKLQEEKAFRVIAEQLPLKVDEKTKKKSGIQMLMKYMAALYVTPENAEAKLKVLSHEKTGNDLHVVIRNEGNKHQILTSPSLIFPKAKTTVKSDELQGMSGENVLAGTERKFVIRNFKNKIPAESPQLKLEK